MADAKIRLAVFDALKAAVPGAASDARCRSYLDGGTNLRLAEFGMDSLARMEFCIAIELATGVALLPAELVALDSTDAVERHLRDRLLPAP